MSDTNEPGFFSKKIHYAEQAARASGQFSEALKAFPEGTTRVVQDLRGVINALIDWQEKKTGNQTVIEFFRAQGLDDKVDLETLADGLDAYAFGAGIRTDQLDEDELREAQYFRDHIVLPLLKSYPGVTEQVLNEYCRQDTNDFFHHLLGDSKTDSVSE